jgi:hypothetical protein
MRILLAILLTLLFGGYSYAQTFTASSRGQVAGKANADEEPSASGVSLLSQADVAVDKSSTLVGLQAMDLFFNKDWRLYIRSTLPVPSEKSSDTAPGGNPPASDGKLADHAIAALLDPYGGVLNLSTGAYTQLPFLKPSDTDSDHGLFVDARVGLKLLSLPQQDAAAPTVLNTTVTPFYSGAVVLKLVRSVFPDANGEHVAGGVEFGVGYVINVVVDKTLSPVFANGTLDRVTHAARFDLAISLTSIAAINVSWNPWTSNSGFGKHFIVGLKLLSPSPAVQ